MSDKEDWESCPKGELRQLGDAIRRENRRKVLRTAGVASVAIVLAGAGIYGISTYSTDDAALTCAEVHKLLPAYIHGGLTQRAKVQVAEHLEKCPKCRKEHESLL